MKFKIASHFSSIWIMINLTPHALEHPIEISETDYDRLVKKTGGGWSHSESHLEFLSKLHYLREGFHAGKIKDKAFLEREEKLITSWWNQGS